VVRNFNGTALGAMTLALASIPQVASAQSTSQAAGADQATAAATTTKDGTQLGEIVVTAEKRPSIAQKTAIAMTVVNAETIQKNGVGNLKDLTSILPGVSFSQQNASIVIGIRGVASRDTNNPAVSLSYDGFYTQAADGLNLSMFDVERVEVLRGPQGTLLGRNATAGAVNVITAKPTKEFGASLSGEVGNYDAYNTNGMLNLPVTDDIQIRAAFQTRDHGGYRDNPVGRDGDDEHSKAGRLSVAFQPTERWKATITGEIAHVNDVGPVVQAVPLVYNSDGTLSLSKPSIPGDGKTFDVTDGGFEHADMRAVRWDTSYDLGFASLTYLGGYRYLHYHRLNTLGGAYGTDRQNLSYNANEHIATWNHEIRLATSSTGRLFWQIGANTFNEANQNYTTFQNYPGSATLRSTPDNIFIYNYPHDSTKSWAVFGQGSYKLTSNLKAEFGARFTKDDRQPDGYAQTANFGQYLTTGALNYTTASVAATYKSQKVTYHGALDWQFTPRNLAYVKYDTGYKAGGINNAVPYGPETITAYEVGSKNRFFDNKLEINADAFYYDYKNQQVTQLLPGSPTSQIVNAGKSQYYGVELEGIALLSHRDRLDGYVSYIHAEYKDFSVANGASNLQLAGNRPPQAPRFTFNAGYQHDFDLFGGTLTPRFQTHYETKSYFTIYNYGADSQGAYHKSDIIVTYKPSSGRWSLEGYVRNLEDKLILSFSQNPASTTYAAYRYQYLAPRTFGGKLTINW
jgi:iron complex outermembrane receptor protein